MADHSFADWLQREVCAARCALLTLYEQYDQMRFMEGPRLEQEYMEAVGTYEENVIREEIECELLRKKQKMIQTAINRQETVDEAAIDQMLEEERQKKFHEAAGADGAAVYAELSAPEMEQLQKLYKEIVRDFHPQMYPELTEVHRQLFEKAQDAYRRRDLAALQLIHEMLYSTRESGLSLEVTIEILKGSRELGRREESDRDYITDYEVVCQIYQAFRPTVEEAAIQKEWEICRQKTADILRKMESMRSEFPYIAADMLSSQEKIQAYKEELSYRMHAASEERERRTREIREQLKEEAANG